MKRRKAKGMVEVAMCDADLFNTGFDNSSGNKSVVTVKMDGKDTVLELVEEVGHGSFATVWKAVDGNSKKVFAVKVVDGRRSVGATEAQKEAMMMEQLDTQFVVAVFGCGFTQNTMAIAMEFFPLGSLQNVLQQDKLPSNARVPMLLDIAKAMAYLHTNGIIHRDLKPGNVLVCSIDPNLHPMSKFVSFFLSFSNKRVSGERMNESQHTTHRISDFGEARTVESMEASMTMTSGVGTPFFMAPEMATGTKHYTGAVDVFSFGIMAAQVMVGRLVYDSSDAFETEFGLLFSISLFFTTKPTTLSFSFVFHLSLVLIKPTTTQRLWMQSAKDFDLVCLVVQPR